jgi:hypothetical protein
VSGPDELLARVLAAHGGQDRWNDCSRLSARVRAGGALWTLKQQEGVLADYVAGIDPHRQSATLSPFGGPGLRGVFTPDRVAVEDGAGEVVEERTAPRAAFDGHHRDTPWDRLHVAYFAGYAMWGYLTEPFSFAWPGVAVEELPPWQEDGETWRRLKVTFPAGFAAHTRENVYYVDGAGLIRRHDYRAEVLGPEATVSAHYITGHREFGGIIVPTERRVWRVDEDGHPVKEPLLVSIDISEVTFG